MVTEDKLAQRQELRTAWPVLEVLEAFWVVFEKTNGTFEEEGQMMLTRDGYEKLYERAYKLLLEAWDPDDAKQTISDDWAEDARGRPGLTKDAFFDGSCLRTTDP